MNQSSPIVNSKKSFVYRKRNQLSLLCVIIAFAIMYWDYKHYGVASSPFQWAIFLIGLIVIIYLKFYLTIDDNEIEDMTDGHWKKDLHMHDLKKQEWIEVGSDEIIQHELKENNMQNQTIMENKEKGNDVPDYQEFKNKTSITVKVNQTIKEKIEEVEKLDEEKNNLTSEKDGKIIINEIPVKSYSTTNIHKKYRAMFDDIHSFALSGEKTVDELKNRLNKYGHPYVTKFHEGKQSSNLVAFDLSFIRIPIKGYFGTK